MPELAEQTTHVRERLFGRGLGFGAPSPRRRVYVFGGGEPTGGLFDYPERTWEESVGWRLAPGSMRPEGAMKVYSGWMKPEGERRVYFAYGPSDCIELGAPSARDTLSLFAPMLLTRAGTGYVLDDLRATIPKLWAQEAPVKELPAIEVATPLVIDVPEALKEARTKAGLPVQDLAAMFGIKRRQFYNLLSGEDTTDPAREPRIARIVNAIRHISDQVGSNSRKVRAVLLGRIDGDSVYDAAVADDTRRLDRALQRALVASAEGLTPARRSAPSTRATPEEAAAIRDFLRATRDETGNDVPDA